MTQPQTREPQYQIVLDRQKSHGLARFGLMSNTVWGEDPKRLCFLLARYKFVAKMLAGKGRVLEVGCADAFGTRVVQQTVGHVTAVDFDALFIEDAKAKIDPSWPLDLRVCDMLAGPVEPRDFDAAYSLDVIEHIEQRDEERFLRNLVVSLAPHGVAIIGMPSLESQNYASPASKEGHINCKSAPDFEALMRKYFRHTFMFSMNDEVVHTGFHKMAHYLIAVCAEQIPPAT